MQKQWAPSGIASAAASPLSLSAASSRCATPIKTMMDSALPWHWSADEVATCPSVEDGMTHADVLERKHHAYVFIEEMRAGIKFQPIIVATAMTLYHRFYHYQSMKQFKWKEMAWCCLFTAFKIEEKVMKMESLLKWSHHVSCKLTKMPRVEMERNKLDVNGREFFEMKERLQFNERVLLQTIGFDVDIKQAGFMIITLVKTLKQKHPKYTSAWAKSIAKVAFEWSTCSAGSELCLKHKPEIVAVAFVYGAAHNLFGQLEHPSDTVKMWDLFHLVQPGDVTERLLHGIMTEFHGYCHRFKEPRAHWRWVNSDAARAGDKSAVAPPVAPPIDPVQYDPDVAAAAPVAFAAAPAVALTAAPSVVSTAAPTVKVASVAAPAVAAPRAASAAVPAAAAAAAPSVASAAPAAAIAVDTPSSSSVVTPVVAAHHVDVSPSRSVALAQTSGTAGSGVQPTPPRTAENTPYSSPASASPGGAMVSTEVISISTASMVVTDGHVDSASKFNATLTHQSFTESMSAVSPSRREKRPLEIEEIPPSGGDGCMKDESIAWHDPPAAKRGRDES